MRVVVIGGTRFIGPCVVRGLRERGFDVTVFHRGESCGDASHVHDDRAHLADHGLSGDVVIDMCAMNERDAETLVAAHLAPRLVVISSADVYRQYDVLRRVAPGPPDPVPLGEDAPLREKLFPYAGHDYEKILVERVVMREPGATVLRLPAVYGPHDAQHRFRAWLAPKVRMQRDQAGWRWTRGYVENVADAIVAAAIDDNATGRIYNVGEPDAPPDEAWARMCGAEVELADEVEGTPPFDFGAFLVTDTTRIRRELGWTERISREEAVRRTVEWERTATG